MPISIIYIFKIINIANYYTIGTFCLYKFLLYLQEKLLPAASVVKPCKDILLHQSLEGFLGSDDISAHLPQFIAPF